MRKFFAFVLAFIFFILLPVWLVLYNVKFNFTEADFYKKALAKSGIYENVVDLAVDNLTNSLFEQAAQSEEGVPFLAQDELKSEIKNLAHDLISKDFLQRNVEAVLDGLLPWLKSHDSIDQLQIKLSLSEVKEKAPGLIRERILVVINRLPDCTQEEDFSQTISCLPSDFREGIVSSIENEEEFNSGIGSFLGQIPDDIDLQNFFPQDQSAPQVQGFMDNIESGRYVYQLIAGVIFWSLSGFLCLLLLSVALLTMKSIRSMIRWLGLTIFVPSAILAIIFVLPSLLFWPVAGFFIKANTTSSPLPPELAENLIRTVSTLYSSLMVRMILPILILLGLGLVLFIVSFFIKKKPKAGQVVVENS